MKIIGIAKYFHKKIHFQIKESTNFFQKSRANKSKRGQIQNQILILKNLISVHYTTKNN